MAVTNPPSLTPRSNVLILTLALIPTPIGHLAWYLENQINDKLKIHKVKVCGTIIVRVLSSNKCENALPEAIEGLDYETLW